MNKVMCSEELREIMSNALDYSRKYGLKQVTTTSLIYSLVMTYREKINSNYSPEDVESSSFFIALESLSITDRDNLCHELEECLRTSTELTEYGSEHAYTREVEFILDTCADRVKFIRGIKDGEDISLSTAEISAYFMTEIYIITKKGKEYLLLKHPTYEEPLMILDKYEINSTIFPKVEDAENRSMSEAAKFLKKEFEKFLRNIGKDRDRDDEEDEGDDNNEDEEFRSREDWDKAKKNAKKDAQREFEKSGVGDAVSGFQQSSESKTPTLDTFAVNMNQKALESKYDPVIGRDNEVKEIIRVLSCRLCNNPLLLGDPGCGKTAIVEYLAGLIAKKDNKVPEFLYDKVVYSLDVNSVVAGCMYRGQFEERMQKIIKEVVEAKNIIVYIDEIHNMMGAGAGGKEGNGDMANILKPFLSRGEFQCIGSTTTSEYRKFIESDKALVRRFGPLFIGEPNIQDTISIIKGLSKTYEKFHKVKYDEDALVACVELSDRYINDGFFPSKAIKIMDKAGSDVKIKKPIDTTEIKAIEDKIAELDKKKSDIILVKDPDNLEEATAIKSEVDSLKKELEKKKSKLEKDRSLWAPVTIDDVMTVVSETSGVPVNKIKSTDLDKVREMKAQIEKKVVGQDEAVEELSVALQQNILGLRDPKKPIASFLFVGCTGTGKTLTAKTIAEEFFGSEKNLVTIACSEYMQDWAESKLLGSAPGYVGFDTTEPRLYVLKRQPYTVLLVDEIEKSSNNLYNIWLNMLEEGEITLSSGEKVSCRNCIIIFTGNVGTKSLETKGRGIGFDILEGEAKKKVDTDTVMKEVNKEFRPEFLNRLTKIVVFNSLDKSNLENIYDLEFKKLRDMIKKERKIDIKATSKVKDLVVSKVDPKYGARSLKRLINEYVQKEICKKMLEESIGDRTKVKLDVNADSKVVVEFS